MRVCVLGAGAVGLSSALQIQAAVPGLKVTIVADRFTTHTTSTGAAGICIPNMSSHKDSPPEKMRQWFADSFTEYTRLVHSPDASNAGTFICSGYILYETQIEEQNPLYSQKVFNFRRLSPDEMKALNIPDKFKYSYQVTTFIVDPKYYLPFLMERFRRNGGNIESRRIEKVEELVGQYDVVVNCTALGSRQLFGDRDVYPIRGQLVRVKAPWVKHFLFNGHQTYMIPGVDCLTLGGVDQPHQYTMVDDPEVTKAILKRCRDSMPSLQGAAIDRVWVGLRPHRDAIRLEQETLTFPNGHLKVVHNYGHGSNGIALSWGTATEAAALTKDFLSRTSARL